MGWPNRGQLSLAQVLGCWSQVAWLPSPAAIIVEAVAADHTAATALGRAASRALGALLPPGMPQLFAGALSAAQGHAAKTKSEATSSATQCQSQKSLAGGVKAPPLIPILVCWGPALART